MTAVAPILAGSPWLALVGPTAVGKSEVALLLAEKLGGEIISVDSMQVYRGLDIGTAKPSVEERARTAHYLVDVAEINEEFDAARFVRLAQGAFEQIQARGKLPVLCGGTGLYFNALLHGLGSAPTGLRELRAELEAAPVSRLLQELEQRDPVAYARIDQRNIRRVIRAIEVIRLTGRPFSLQRADWSEAKAGTAQLPIFGLTRRPEDLRQRIDRRVDIMFRRGLVAETEALLKHGLERSRTAGQALGYRQAMEYLRGARSLPETIALVKTRTRQFAKRQMTWFRRQLPVNWIEVASEQSAGQIAEKVCRRLKELFRHQYPQDQQDHKNRDEQEKKELGDIRGRAGDAGEAQNGRNDGDDQENGSPS